MALPITIPYTFANATTSIPLANLDSDFTVVVNAINGIANGTNSLANVNIIGGTITGISFSNLAASIQNVNGNAVTITTAPTPVGNWSSITTAFSGNLAKTQLDVQHSITGTSTLGQPTSGYVYTQEAYPKLTYLFNSSGWNNSTSGNSGRTGAASDYVKVDQYGQGDVFAHTVQGFVASSKSGATDFLANPAVGGYNGDFSAGIAGAYLNPIEVSSVDNGYDIASASYISNMARTNATGSLHSYWVGFRAQSVGAASVDQMFAGTGKTRTGLDFSGVTFDTSGTYTQAAVTLPLSARIYGNATYGGGSTPYTCSNTGSDWIERSSSGYWNIVYNNTSAVQISDTTVSHPTQNLGIGTTNTGGFRAAIVGPASGAVVMYLHTDAGNAYLYSSGAYYIGSTTSNPVAFVINNGVALYLDTGKNVGIGTTSPTAKLDVQSTTSGVRFPNMTTTQKNAISSPQAGTVVFDTTLAKLCVYSGSAWQTITSV